MDKLLGPYIKLERARTHINDLRFEIASFIRSEPYRITIEHDPETDMVGPFADIRALVPHYWAGIIGDAIHNMRASFDLALNAVVADKFFGDARASIYAFPSDQYPFGIPIIRGLSAEHYSKLIDLQPYNTGNNDLRLIHELDIRDKHQMLVLAATASALLDLRATAFGGTISVGSITIDTSSLGKQRLGVRINIAGNPLFDQNARVITKITFAEPEALKGKEVIEVLDRLLEASHAFVSEFVPKP